MRGLRKPYQIFVSRILDTSRKPMGRIFAIIGGFFVAGLVLTLLTCFTAAGLTGAGHGIYVPTLYTCPAVWVIMCPFIIAGANSPWRPVRTGARIAACLYYSWLLLHVEDLFRLPGEYHRVASKVGEDFWVWVALVTLTHSLIWLPAVIIACFRRWTANGKG